MSVDPDNVLAVTMPQVNVNDEEVTLIGWHVKDGTVMQRYWGMIGVNRNGVGLGGTNQ